MHCPLFSQTQQLSPKLKPHIVAGGPKASSSSMVCTIALRGLLHPDFGLEVSVWTMVALALGAFGGFILRVGGSDLSSGKRTNNPPPYPGIRRAGLEGLHAQPG